MEVRARYILMGLFTLVAIGIGFAFVYWLQAPGRVGQRAVYRIQFGGPVSGLLKGSAVLFNGIRVGEVTALQLNEANPAGVTTVIAIDRGAPVRADTKVSIDFQGLTGAPVVSLAGGSASLPALATDKGDVPLLAADKTAGQGMSQTANEVLRRIDEVVADNAAPLKSAIASIDRFAGALARNSDKVDGIVAGLERLTGGGAKLAPRTSDLQSARSFPGLKAIPTVQLIVPEPTALSAFDNDKLQVRGATADKPSLEGTQWPDSLPKLVQVRILQSFENAHYLQAIGRGPEGLRSDFQLLLDIRGFHIQAGAALSADLEVSGKVVSTDGRIVAAQVFKTSVPVASLDPLVAAKALSDALESIASEIVVWTCASI